VIRIIFTKLEPQTDVLAGAALGEKHWKQIAGLINEAGAVESVVLLDFDGVAAATASYFKQTLSLFHGDGRATRNAYPIYINVSPSVEDDIHHFLLGQKWPGIIATFKRGKPWFRKLIGALEPAAVDTWNHLTLIGSGSAADVMQAARSQVALTAWNNRLAELSRLRLTERKKNGRFWIYKPTVEVTNNG
jgi:hypothetical protein